MLTGKIAYACWNIQYLLFVDQFQYIPFALPDRLWYCPQNVRCANCVLWRLLTKLKCLISARTYVFVPGILMALKRILGIATRRRHDIVL